MSQVASSVRGHPKGLYILFFTEMWERFAFYGMRALLVYYMTKDLFLPDTVRKPLGQAVVQGVLESISGPLSVQALSSQIYGYYTWLVYLTPFFGGLLADRVLGQRKTVVVGGLFMAAGQFLLSVPELYYIGLLLMIFGNGCFKPNISTQVGALYPPDDPRRDSAFSIFYMGINIGAFFSPLICGTLGEVYGWRYGFIASGVGMLLGLIFYMWGQKFLAPDNLTQSRKDKVKLEPLTATQWKAMGALVLLCMLNIVFWAVYEQQGNTLALWADANTNRHLIPGVDWEMPATWFQSVNPLFIVALTPLLTMFWGWQSRRGKEPSSITKMAMGCALLGVAFIVLVGAAQVYASGDLASSWWLISSILVLTVGELYLSPVGLSLVTKVAPPQSVSMMMGIWFFFTGFGDLLAGLLGSYWEKMDHTDFFWLMTVMGVVAGIIIWLFNIPLKKAMGKQGA